MKKLFSLFFFFLFTLTTFAAETVVNGIRYSTSNETMEAQVIANGESKYSGDIVIPESIKIKSFEYSVTSIGERAFYGCSNMVSVTIPKSVTSIGLYAFNGCFGLTSVNISDLSAWCRINFSGGSDSNPLHYASKLILNGEIIKDLAIPDDVTSIGKCAFDGDSNLTSVTIHNSVTSIGSFAFGNCSNLTSINISNLSSWCHINFNGGIFSYSLFCAHKLFLNGEEIKNLIIPDDVTSIGGWAFYGCSGITSVIIPNSVTDIGGRAFYNCSDLTSLTIGSSVEDIGNEAFAYCNKIENVYCSAEKVPTASSDAFADSDIDYCMLYVPKASISQYKTSAPWNGFGRIQSLEDLPIPAEIVVDGIKYSTDSETKQVKVIANNYYGEIVIPTSINIHDIDFHVTCIGDSAFYGCSDLTSVSIGKSVTNIGEEAFCGCSRLTSVTIPNSLKSIGRSAFEGCSRLTSVNISDLSAWCNIKFGLFSNPLSYAHKLLLNGEEIKDLIIPDDVTSIEDWAFYGCSGITSVIIGKSVASIGEEAFCGCSGLISVTIPNSLKSIGHSAFQRCSSLTSINISNLSSWCRIKFGYYSYSSYSWDHAHKLFLNGEEIKDLIIPDDVTSIGDYAFQFCSNITSVAIPNSVTSIGDYAFQFCSSITSVTIPNSVNSIGDYAFSGCSSITSVTIPNSVNSIGDYAFSYCYSLLSVAIPNSVTSIGRSAFMYCYSLLSVTIPNSVTSIGDEAFNLVANICYSGTAMGAPWGAKSLNGFVDGYLIYRDETKTELSACSAIVIGEITIPGTVKSIGNSAFECCYGLTSVTIPNSVASIGDEAFYLVANICYSGTATGAPWGAKSLNGFVDGYLIYRDETKTELSACPISATGEIAISNSVISIGDYAFQYCSSITSVTIPNSVNSIGAYAFSWCSGLTSVTIPNSVTSIGDYALSGCTSLESIVCLSATPPMCNQNVFQYMDKQKCTLYVPESSIEAYANADYWREFVNIEAYKAEYVPGDVNNDGVLSVADIAATASYILGIVPEGFNKEAADSNNDGVISVSDLSLLANKILGNSSE